MFFACWDFTSVGCVMTQLLSHYGYLFFFQHGPDKHSNMPSDGTVHELTRNVRCTGDFRS